MKLQGFIGGVQLARRAHASAWRIRRVRLRAPLWQALARLRVSVLLRSPAAAGLAATLALACVLLPLRWAGTLEGLELAAYDQMIAVRAAAPPGAVERRVTEIGATEADIARFGWPLPDGVLAQAILRLHAAGARAIGVDLFRPAPIGPGSEALDEALAEAKEVVWADRFAQGRWEGIPAPVMVTAAGRNGFSDIVLDPGGAARRGLLFLDDGHTVQEALPLKLATLYLAAEGIQPVGDPEGFLRLGHVSLAPLDQDLGAYRSIDTRGYQILREFRAPARLAAFSLADLLDGKVPAEMLRDRIVMLGTTSDSVKDSVAVPLSGDGMIPGVALHGLFAAQLVAAGLDGEVPTHPLSRGAEAVLIALALLGGGLAGTLIPRAAWLAATLVGGACLLVGGSVLALLHAVWLPVVPLAGFWLLAGLVAAAAMSQAMRAQRGVLMRLFSVHVSGPIAREIWRRRDEFVAEGRPVPMRLTATVLFSDINDFTTYCERMEPEDVVRWLDGYMQSMTRLIEEHGGVVERFAGDGILAMFGVPLPRRTATEIEDDAIAAVRCACRMGAVLRALNEAYRRDGLPETQIAVGIQSGELVTCSLGSPERQQYTTMGDTTNTAARLVGVAKDWMKGGFTDAACCVVIGESTRALLRDRFDLNRIGALELKGKSRLTECYVAACERAPVAEPAG